MKEVEKEVEQTEKEVRREIEERKDVETSINMETYFLPSVSHSLLEDSQAASAGSRSAGVFRIVRSERVA